MKTSLSFKDYLDSKKVLREAEDKIPVLTKDYESKKYCKFPLLKEKNSDDKKYISLKPKDKLRITWKYYNLENPTPISVNIVKEDIDENDKEYFFTWNENKINSWVNNTLNEYIK